MARKAKKEPVPQPVAADEPQAPDEYLRNIVCKFIETDDFKARLSLRDRGALLLCPCAKQEPLHLMYILVWP